MKPVTQTRFGYPEGNCFMAAIASVIECELDELPDLCDEEEWWDVTVRALRGRGWHVVWMADWMGVPAGLALAGGDSPREEVVTPEGKNAGHVVVVQDGELVHDPHPSGAGLVPGTVVEHVGGEIHAGARILSLSYDHVI